MVFPKNLVDLLAVSHGFLPSGFSTMEVKHDGKKFAPSEIHPVKHLFPLCQPIYLFKKCRCFSVFFFFVEPPFWGDSSIES